MGSLDHLLPFIDNGGRRLHIERRRNLKLARIPDRRKYKDRRANFDRRGTQKKRALKISERRTFSSRY